MKYYKVVRPILIDGTQFYESGLTIYNKVRFTINTWWSSSNPYFVFTDLVQAANVAKRQNLGLDYDNVVIMRVAVEESTEVQIPEKRILSPTPEEIEAYWNGTLDWNSIDSKFIKPSSDIPYTKAFCMIKLLFEV